MLGTIVFLVFLAAAALKLYLHLTTGRYAIKKSLKGKHILITGGTAGETILMSFSPPEL